MHINALQMLHIFIPYRNLLIGPKIWLVGCFGTQRPFETVFQSILGRLSELVVCFGFSGPLRQYFSLYRAVDQEEERKDRRD